jgi:hypothetical protein
LDQWKARVRQVYSHEVHHAIKRDKWYVGELGSRETTDTVETLLLGHRHCFAEVLPGFATRARISYSLRTSSSCRIRMGSSLGCARHGKASSQNPGGIQELKNTLQKAFEYDEADLAFCIFIDGLDEFAEDHFTLIIELVEHHAQRPNVKFCVSSRPYNVFRTAFGKEATRTFAL